MKKFLLIAATCMVALSLGSCTQNATRPGNYETNAELYNFRDLIQSPEGYATYHEEIFKALAEQGYTGVEPANYADGKLYGVSPEQFKADVEAAGLKVVCSHVRLPLSDEQFASGDYSANMPWWDECIAAHKAAGVTYLVCPYMKHPITMDELKVYVDYLNAIGKKCAEQGIQFGYHNHSHEFAKIDDMVIYDYMAQNLDPNYVFLQMDVYWAVMAGVSPVEYFNKYPGRFKMLHIKDHYEIGQSGMVGFDAIFRNFDVAGTEQIVVEVEHFSPNVGWEEGMKTSIDYLNDLRDGLR